ncbi:hypothetical protein SUGI_0681750 [Cryptomeria japonica]|nr:hypothetical protein SUGI_0681750 [Cryptomeria japonica]
MHNTTAWGFKVAASRWGHQGDTFGYGGVGAQPIELSSKGGADIQPLQVDETVSFDYIGGLFDHIDALKEIVFLPLLYLDFFANYHISPPRGVLLCGPPGTRKTLIARSLACAASKEFLKEEDDRNEGEAGDEREEDEEDEVEEKGEKEELRMELAATCVGYCGANFKVFCIEAAINALYEKYPQVYTSSDKFVIDLDSVKVEKHDFLKAMYTITPTTHRGATVQSRPFSPVISPCLQGHLKIISNYISEIFYVVAKGDKKYLLNVSSCNLAKLLGLPYGSSIPFVYRQDFYFVGRRVLAW